MMIPTFEVTNNIVVELCWGWQDILASRNRFLNCSGLPLVYITFLLNVDSLRLPFVWLKNPISEYSSLYWLSEKLVWWKLYIILCGFKKWRHFYLQDRESEFKVLRIFLKCVTLGWLHLFITFSLLKVFYSFKKPTS